jgi:tetratricopeptide (TPR) repeat protein
MSNGTKKSTIEKSKQSDCFIVCPIGKENSRTRSRSDYIKEYVIEPALKGLFHSTRADQMSAIGRIDDSMIRNIIESELVIVDFTDNNPNVYFEFGIRCALGDKPFICICNKKQISSLPFDSRQYHVVSLPMDLIDYDWDVLKSRKDEEEAISEIRKLAISIKDSPGEFISPVVTQGLILQQLAQTESNSDVLRIILDKLSILDISTNEIMRLGPLDERSNVPDLQIQDPLILLQRGESLFQEREFEQASRLLRSVIEIEPANITALYYLGQALTGEGKFREAKTYLEQVLSIKPDFERVKEMIGKLKEKINIEIK